MTLYESSSVITSSVTPEWARRIIGNPDPEWVLSWLPDHPMSYENARAAMQLAEIVSSANASNDIMGTVQAITIADQLGITVEYATAALYRRRCERDGA